MYNKKDVLYINVNGILTLKQTVNVSLNHMNTKATKAKHEFEIYISWGTR